MEGITFHYLISMEANMNLDMKLMDIVTASVYGSLDTRIYMKIPYGFKIPKIKENENPNMYSVKLQRSLYGLKKSGRMWYNRLSEFLLKREYICNTPKYTLVVFDMFKVFCRHKLNFS